MRQGILLLAVVVAAGLVAGCHQNGHEHGEARPIDVEAARQAIDHSNNEWSKAAVAGNVAAIARLYTDDAVLMPPNMPRATGMDEITSMLTEMFAETSFDAMKITTDSIEPAGDMLIVTGSFEDKGTTAGEPFEDKGKWLGVFRRPSRRAVAASWWSPTRIAVCSEPSPMGTCVAAKSPVGPSKLRFPRR